MRLFIRAESTQKDLGLFPADMLSAVVGAEIGGTGPNRWLVMRQPLGLQLPNGAATSPMFELQDPNRPLWLMVDKSYAGDPRIVNTSEYETIWFDWFFYPAGSRYSPLQQVRLPRSGKHSSMEEVRTAYLMLRRLQHRVPEDFEHLGLVAQDPKLSVVPAGRQLAGFARRALGLECDDELNDRGRTLLGELLMFDTRLQRMRLVKPWHRNLQ